MQTHTHTNTCTHTRMHAQACTHTHTHTNTCTHTHTHARTHLSCPVLSSCYLSKSHATPTRGGGGGLRVDVMAASYCICGPLDHLASEPPLAHRTLQSTPLLLDGLDSLCQAFVSLLVRLPTEASVACKAQHLVRLLRWFCLFLSA